MKETDYKHVMVDIETMGNTSMSAMVSIAAVPFDLETGKIHHREGFHENISLESSIKAGLHVDASTIMWWLQQDKEAVGSLIIPYPISLEHCLYLFTQWFEKHIGSSGRLWGNSARFDLGIIEDSYKAVGKKVPWDFRNERDVRTLVAFAPEIKQEMPFEGIKHNPVDDCIHQIKYCTKIWNTLSHE